jgi:AraC family transcriptional regulator
MASKSPIEWRARSENAEVPKQGQIAKWSDFSAELNRIPHSAEFDYKLVSANGYIALHNIVRIDGETIVEGTLHSQRRDLRDKMTFIPPGASVEGWTKTNGGTPYVFAVHFEPSQNQDAPDLSNLPYQLYFENDDIKSTLNKMRVLMERGEPDDRLYAETLGVLLRHEIARRFQSEPVREQLRGGLSTRQLQKLQAYIDGNFTADISLQNMADLLDISRSHLLSAFKQSTGMSPYQYVLQMRVERAKVLMNNPRMSLSEIAKTIGFRTNLQLNRAFRRFSGLPPRDFRRDKI